MARNEKKKAMNAYIDAQAKTAKARASLDAAMARYMEVRSAEWDARRDCEEIGLPVNGAPIVLKIVDIVGAGPKP